MPKDQLYSQTRDAFLKMGCTLSKCPQQALWSKRWRYFLPTSGNYQLRFRCFIDARWRSKCH